MIVEGAPDLVPKKMLGLFHVRLAGLVVEARRHGIEVTGEVFQFCVVALTTNNLFFLDPILKEGLKNLRQRTVTFSALVNSWSDEIWEALSKTYQ